MSCFLFILNITKYVIKNVTNPNKLFSKICLEIEILFLLGVVRDRWKGVTTCFGSRHNYRFMIRKKTNVVGQGQGILIVCKGIYFG